MSGRTQEDASRLNPPLATYGPGGSEVWLVSNADAVEVGKKLGLTVVAIPPGSGGAWLEELRGRDVVLALEPTCEQNVGELASSLAAVASSVREPLDIDLADYLDVAHSASDIKHARAKLVAYKNDRPLRGWLVGAPMDPAGVPAEPLLTIPGFPFAYSGGSSTVVSGPTGSGRSALFQACAYDGSRHGVRTAYLSAEVSEGEFNARAADLAQRRGDGVDGELRSRLSLVRYLDLASVIIGAWDNPTRWAEDAAGLFDVVVLDPLSAVAAALGLDFDKSNADYVRFHEALVQPLVARGLFVLVADNVGHDQEARNRPKGASSKGDRADTTFACKPKGSPQGLIVTAGKVRSVRAPFRRGDQWLFDRETQRIRQMESQERAGAFRPTGIMEKVSRLLEADPGITKSGILGSISSKKEHVNTAVEFLIAEKYVRIDPEEHRPGHPQHHYSIRPYRDEQEESKVIPIGAGAAA